MSKRKRSRTPKAAAPRVELIECAVIPSAWVRAAVKGARTGRIVGIDWSREVMNSYTVRRNERGELTARRGDGVEFVGPVTL